MHSEAWTMGTTHVAVHQCEVKRLPSFTSAKNFRATHASWLRNTKCVYINIKGPYKRSNPIPSQKEKSHISWRLLHIEVARRLPRSVRHIHSLWGRVWNGSEDNGLQLSHPDVFPRSDSENICEMSIATKPTQGLLLRSKPAFQVVLCLTPGLSGSRETIWRHNLFAETIPAESDCQPKRAGCQPSPI